MRLWRQRYTIFLQSEFRDLFVVRTLRNRLVADDDLHSCNRLQLKSDVTLVQCRYWVNIKTLRNDARQNWNQSRIYIYVLIKVGGVVSVEFVPWHERVWQIPSLTAIVCVAVCRRQPVADIF